MDASGGRSAVNAVSRVLTANRQEKSWTYALKGSAASVVVLSLALTMSGCAELPASAPTAGEIESSSNVAASGIYVFNLDKTVMSVLSHGPESGFAGHFGSRAPAADLRIAVGDSLQVSVIEESGSLFRRPNDTGAGANSSTNPNSSALLPVIVERDGTVTVPYAGKIKAAGLTPADLAQEIEHKLVDKAVNPQVQVVPSTAVAAGAVSTANSAAVGGEVNRAGVIALRTSGSKVLDVISEAGGARFPAYETNVHLTRGGRQAEVSLQRIIDRPAENIYVYPGDSIYVSHEPKMFSVLGASTKVGRYTFGSETLNLAEAVAEAGGFVDNAADPSGVFVFRYEPASIIRALKPGEQLAASGVYPVIYRLNLRDGDGFFRARQFQVRDKDIVLLANADGAQLLKLVTLLEGITGTAVNARVLSQPLNTTGGGSTTTTTVVVP